VHPLIYLDYNATTPCHPRVVESMLPYLREMYGNPANGLHLSGRMAARAVEHAREQVAALIGAAPGEIVFTSGATESNNLAILGLARWAEGRRRRIITSAVEHKAVLGPCKKLGELGYDVVVLPVDSTGQILLESLERCIDEDTLLVSVQAANNEVGTLQPVREIAAIAHRCGAVFHCDAAQAVGKIPVDALEWGVDLLSISAHKMYGPKGVGALFVGGGLRAIPLEPLAYGGGQEYGLRPGTLNVPGIVGLGAACELAAGTLAEEADRQRRLRDRFEDRLRATVAEFYVNGHPDRRLPNTSSLTFPGIDAEALLLAAPGLALSTGSACNAGTLEPSHVLQAMGLSRADASATIRVSLGRHTTEEEIRLAAELLSSALRSFVR
jgi:cysteine desulfurase